MKEAFDARSGWRPFKTPKNGNWPIRPQSFTALSLSGGARVTGALADAWLSLGVGGVDVQQG